MTYSRKTIDTVDAELTAAMQQHGAGNLSEAAALYERVLRRQPRNGRALHLLGTLALQLEQTPQAIALLQAAAETDAANAECHNSLGGALHRAGRMQEALKSFAHAVELQPQYGAALVNCGRVLEELGDLEGAVHSFRCAVAAEGNWFEAQMRLGVALLKAQRSGEALAACQKALALRPDSAEAHFNLAHALDAEERWQEAAEHCRAALRLNPRLAEAHNNLGHALHKLKDLEGASEALRASVALKPDSAVTYYNLGTVLAEQRNYRGAIENFHAALCLQTDFADASYNLGNAYRDVQEREQAIKAYSRALELRPAFALCWTALGNALADRGSYPQAEECYRESLRLAPDVADTYFCNSTTLREMNRLEEATQCLRRALELDPHFVNAYSNLLYQHAVTRDVSCVEERRQAEGWERAALSEEERAAARQVTFTRKPRAGRKLRLGILSAEIGEHAASEFLEPLLAELDHSRFAVTLFPSYLRSTPRAARMMKLAEAVVPVAEMTDAEAAEKIRGCELDVLVETTGHTRECRLGICARRAAPVQVSYIGYWSTTGLTEMDWVFGDPETPAHYDGYFCERIWRLPRLAICYHGDAALPESAWRRAADGTVWLGSFNRTVKIRQETLALWARVMRELPETRLLLEDREEDCAQKHRRILSSLQELGVDAGRVEFAPMITSHVEHMRLYDRLDIALDTIPFTSGTTACDALWMGVPLVTLETDWHGGRIAASMLRAAGLGKWVASNDAEYVATVTRLARDVEARVKMRATQRAQVAGSSLCDAKGMTRALEEAWEGMFDEYWAHKGPSG
ncbi:MAG: tetratricopeptide repeat protein [Acidobacteriota bacterium]|nr:tetratricopeptide repeat protein [Acidobacteriota bacterium]